jgi:hypothetical protein
VGQLKPADAIFLSASVPDPAADHFVLPGDSAAITAAVSALLYVTLGRRRLVWGGHPAITPMVWSVAEAMDVHYGAWVSLYQSLIFKDEFPAETARFKNVIFTEAVGFDRPGSLAVMRARMIGDNDFSAAVFIGGMGGILDELALLKQAHRNARIVPIASTGGAAQLIAEQENADQALAKELDYVALLYTELGIDPNERRYRRPVEQPVNIADRIRAPGEH